LRSRSAFSKGGFYLPLILVDSLYGLEDRHLAVASFANALAGCLTRRPLEGPAYRLDHAVVNAFVFHNRQIA
jgi:hypothetical protein